MTMEMTLESRRMLDLGGCRKQEAGGRRMILLHGPLPTYILSSERGKGGEGGEGGEGREGGEGGEGGDGGEKLNCHILDNL